MTKLLVASALAAPTAASATAVSPVSRTRDAAPGRSRSGRGCEQEATPKATRQGRWNGIETALFGGLFAAPLLMHAVARYLI
jgi:hypothetical protein